MTDPDPEVAQRVTSLRLDIDLDDHGVLNNAGSIVQSNVTNVPSGPICLNRDHDSLMSR
jgi:hypothetical protein